MELQRERSRSPHRDAVEAANLQAAALQQAQQAAALQQAATLQAATLQAAGIQAVGIHTGLQPTLYPTFMPSSVGMEGVGLGGVGLGAAGGNPLVDSVFHSLYTPQPTVPDASAGNLVGISGVAPSAVSGGSIGGGGGGGRGGIGVLGSGYEDFLVKIVQREQARLRKDFAEADSLRATLKNMGVEVFDKSQSWKHIDGRAGRVPTFTEIEQGINPLILVTTGSTEPQTSTSPVATIDSMEHAALINQLTGGLTQPLGGVASSIPGTMLGYGVGAPLAFPTTGFATMPDSMGLSHGLAAVPSQSPGSTNEEFLLKIVQREQARLRKDFSMADNLRSELKGIGVEVFDKSASWTHIDGRTGRVPTFTEIEQGINPSILVNQPLNMNPPSATVATAPIGGFGGFVASPATSPVLSYPDPAASSGSDDFLHLIVQREQARLRKEFSTADALRSQLRGMGVETFDKVGTWTHLDGRSGRVPTFTEIEQGIDAKALVT